MFWCASVHPCLPYTPPSTPWSVLKALQNGHKTIATWLLTTVPSMEPHQPPPWFVPTVQFHALRFWRATILPRPPVSLPSIFPPPPRPHPRASRLAPLHLPSPAPSPPCTSRLAPLHLPSPRPHPPSSLPSPIPTRLAPLHLPGPTPSTFTSIFRPRQRTLCLALPRH